MLTLNNLQKNKQAVRRRKRVGRGNSSGRGTYSTRGLKGQRSRSGGRSGLGLRSIKSYLLHVPKNRGFKSLTYKLVVVNIGDLEANFAPGAKINVRALLKIGLINNISQGVKILASGNLTKNFIVEADSFSAGAKDKIIKAGGQAIIIVKAKDDKKNDKSKK